MYLDISILQSVPASNINRDDTGAPKTVIYGGALRARVSSQAWKRAMREYFNQQLTDDDQHSLRTKYVPELLAKEYQKLHPELDDDTALTQAQAICDKAKMPVKKADGDGKLPVLKTAAMVTPNEIKIFAEKTDHYREAPAKIKDTLGKQLHAYLNIDRPLDRALFGRMVASDTDLNVNAAVQVAHAVSTHEIQREYDYFTTVDESPLATGAAMIDTTDFNSSTLFRYGNINIDGLMKNLNSTEAVINGIKLFLKSFALTMPTGHENSFANKTLPAYIMLTLRDDTPVNLVSAFEKPIASHEGFVEPSINAFETEFKNTAAFVDHPVLTEIITKKTTGLSGDQIIHADNLNAAINDITTKINDLLTTQAGD